MDTVEQPPIHYIADGTDVAENQFTLNDLREIYGTRQRHAKIGWSFAITPSLIDRFFGTLVMQYIGAPGRQMATVDEALAFLSRKDDRLPPLDELRAAFQRVKEHE